MVSPVLSASEELLNRLQLSDLPEDPPSNGETATFQRQLRTPDLFRAVRIPKLKSVQE